MLRLNFIKRKVGYRKKNILRRVSLTLLSLFFFNISAEAKQFQIRNSSPIADLGADVLHQKKLDINILTDYTGSKSTSITSKLNQFKIDMSSKSIDVNFKVVDGTSTVISVSTTPNGLAENTGAIMSTYLRDEAEHIFIQMSDGIGEDFSQPYGSYFSLSNLNKTFVNYLVSKAYNIYSITPSSIWDFKSTKSGKQDTTIRQMVNASPLDRKLYDSSSSTGLSELDTLLTNLKTKYSSNTESLFDPSAAAMKDVDIQVLTDYATGSVNYTDLVNKVGNIKPEIYPYNINFSFNKDTDINNDLLNSFKVKKMVYDKSYRMIIDQYGDLYIQVNGFMHRISQFTNVKDILFTNKGVYVLCENGNMYLFAGQSSSTGYLRDPYSGNEIYTKLIYTNVSQMTEFGTTVLLLKNNNTLYYVTSPDYLNVGADSGLTSISLPTTATISQIAGGLVLTADGLVYSAGYEYYSSYAGTNYYSPYGQTLTNTTTSKTYKLTDLKNITRIESNSFFNLAVDSSNMIYVYGDNRLGILSLPNKTQYPSFTSVKQMSNSIKDIDASTNHISYMLSDNSIYVSSKDVTMPTYVGNNAYFLCHNANEYSYNTVSYMDINGEGYTIDSGISTKVSGNGLVGLGVPKIESIQSSYRENWVLENKNKVVNFNSYDKPNILNIGSGNTVSNVFDDDAILSSNGTYYPFYASDSGTYSSNVSDTTHINQYTTDYYSASNSSKAEVAAVTNGKMYYGKNSSGTQVGSLSEVDLPGTTTSAYFIGDTGAIWVYQKTTTNNGMICTYPKILTDGITLSSSSIASYFTTYSSGLYTGYVLSYYNNGGIKTAMPPIKAAFGSHNNQLSGGETAAIAYHLIDYSNNIYRVYPGISTDVPTKVSLGKYDVKFIDSAGKYKYVILLTNDGTLYEGTEISDSMGSVNLSSKVIKAKIVEGKMVVALCDDGNVYVKAVPGYEGFGYLPYGSLVSSTFIQIPSHSADYFVDMDNSGVHLITDDGIVYSVNPNMFDYFATTSFPEYHADSVISSNTKFYSQYNTYVGYMETDLVLRWFSSEPNLYINPSLFRNFTNDGKEHIILYAGDGTTLQKLRKTYRQQLIDNNVIFIGVTPDSSFFSKFIGSDTYQELADATGGKLFTSVDDAVSFIKNKYKVLQDSRKSGYIVKDEDVLLYKKTYSDYERDSSNKSEIYAERWKYNHDNTVFQNDQGVIDNNNIWSRTLTSLITKKSFSKVGSYKISYQAQDNPSLNNKGPNGTIPDEARFSEYRALSLAQDQLQVYVNRRPIAQFSYSLRGTSLTTVNTSFDLDHKSDSDKGIAQLTWKYKKIDDMGWIQTNSPPTTLDTSSTYILSLIVKDVDGFVSRPYTQIIGVNLNNPPVALFKLDANQMTKGTKNTITDQSYDPENDPLAEYHWWLTDSLSTYTIKDYGQVKPDLSTLAQGTYSLHLKVRDNPATRGTELTSLWSDEYIQLLQVGVNNPPVATFSMNSPMYKGDLNSIKNLSYDPDGDELSDTHWWILNSSGTTVIKDCGSNIPDLSTLAIGNYKVKLIVADLPSWGLPLSSSPCIKDLAVIDKTQYKLDVDANPKYSEWTNKDINATITATGGYNYKNTQYAWSTSSTKPSTWQTSTLKSFNTTQTQEGIWYLHMNATDQLSSVYKYRGEYKIDKTPPTINFSLPPGIIEEENNTGDLTVLDVLSGVNTVLYQWMNVNTQQTDLGGFKTWYGESLTRPSSTTYLHVQALDNAGNLSYTIFGPYYDNLTIAGTLTPNPAKQGQKVTFTINTTGYAEKLKIEFPSEIVYLDVVGTSALDSILIATPSQNNTKVITYYLPLNTPVTLDTDGNRIRNPYKFPVTAYKGTSYVSTILTLDVQGSILDGIKTEIK